MSQAKYNNLPKLDSSLAGDALPSRPVELPSQRMEAAEADLRSDVAIVGAGLGGLSACIHLRRAGLRVVCIEPEPFPHARVGESLDWSSPGMLNTLGLPREQLIAEEIAIYKRNIVIKPAGKEAWTGYPKDWMGAKPWHCELVTLQVDRAKFDQRLFEMAQELGVVFLWDRVSSIERDGKRVVAIRTKNDRRVMASWFIDSSGQARLFPREFNIPRDDYGQPKVCLWTYFKTAPGNEGTTFYIHKEPDRYLTWIWEIPITPYETSIGCVFPASEVKSRRERGEQVREILGGELSKHTRLAQLQAASPDYEISTCSYQSYVHRYACGDNWLIVGESASLPDPLTANGVTAAFRHGEDSAKLIVESFERGSLSWRQRMGYNINVRGMGCVFNHSIETSLYDGAIRCGLSTFVAQKVYTTFSYPINVLYSKFRPQTLKGALLFSLVLDVVWLWMVGWSTLGKIGDRVRRFRRWLHNPIGGIEPSGEAV